MRMLDLRPVRLAVLSGLFVATIACAPRDATPSPSPTPASETPAKAAAPARAQPSGPARAGESRVLTGTLRYTEIPAGVQSVAAFRSEDLTLVGEAGETWNLAGSSTVPESQLVALAGKRIEVTATYVAPAAPPADVAAPMDGSAPMQYPARWDVTAVRELGP